mmetsp:Transcript_51043/g.159505  ORF Transcript_51043/g.159505 Transcript_51043/m.159505 type:complete len:81 (-) Transcript_51043:62-304(-)
MTFSQGLSWHKKLKSMESSAFFGLFPHPILDKIEILPFAIWIGLHGTFRNEWSQFSWLNILAWDNNPVYEFWMRTLFALF